MVEAFTSGGIIIDNVVAADGAVHLETMGGNAVYSAAGARLWLERVGILGVVPGNYPHRWLSEVEGAGVDITGVHRAAAEVDCPEWFFHRPDGSRVDGLHAETGALARFGLSTERIDPDDARRFEAHLAQRPNAGAGFSAFRAAHPVEPGHVPSGHWRTARALHLAPNRTDAQRRILRTAKAAGLIVTLDPGLHAGAMTGEDVADILSKCDAFLPSEKELCAIAPGEEPAHAVQRLSGRGPGAMVAKLGAQGSIVFDRRRGRAVAVPPVPVRAPDPTGAGDAFSGGFLAGLLRTADPVLAACWGTVSASFAVEAFGPFHLLRADRTLALERLSHVVSLVPEAQGTAAYDALKRNG